MRPLQPTDPLRIGRYRLEARLGSGGMGQVYLARTPGDRPVVVKVIRPEYADDPEFRARFAHEAEAARRVGGFHTAQVVDADPDAEAPWIVTAFVPAPTLKQLIHQDGPIDPRDLASLASGIAEGLEAIHSCGLVHRDLKPDNILVAEDGPRIIDFGIARPLDGSGVTQTGAVMGTLAYMSPEQAQGHPVGPASDVFSLGTVLAFAATGTNPFVGNTMGAVVLRIISPAPDVDELPREVRKIVKRCWNHDPDKRPTPSEIIEGAKQERLPEKDGSPSPELNEVSVDEHGTKVVSSSPTVREVGGTKLLHEPDRPGQRWKPTLLELLRRHPLAAALCTALMAGLVFWAVPSSEEPPPPEAEPDRVVDLHEGMYDESDDPNSRIIDMVLSPDGTTLATLDTFFLSASFFRPHVELHYARLWDLESGEETTTLKFEDGLLPRQVVFDPDGAPLAFTTRLGNGGEAQLWDIAEGDTVLTLGLEQRRVDSIAFSLDRLTVLTEDRRGSIHEWDATTGEHLADLSDAKRSLADGTLSTDQTMVASKGDTDIALWDAVSGDVVTNIAESESSVHSMAFSPDGMILATGNSDETAHLWDTGSGGLMRSFTTYVDTFYTRNFVQQKPFHAVAFSPDGSTLATGSGDGNVYLWDVGTGELTLTLTGNEEPIRHLAFGAGGATLFAAGAGSLLRMWELG